MSQGDYNKTTHGRIVGGLFLKTIDSSKGHMLLKPLALAVDAGDLQSAERAGAQRIEIFDTATGATYKAEISHFRQHAFVFNRGFGRQLALTLAHWTRTGGDLQSGAQAAQPVQAVTEAAEPAEPQAAQPAQMSFFAEGAQ